MTSRRGAPLGGPRQWFVTVLALALFGAAAGETAFIRTVQKDGRWWLTDAQGREFLCKTSNCVDMGSDPAKYDAANPGYCALHHYKTADAWSLATANRLKGWGFNAVGGYSEHARLAKAGNLPYTVALVLGGMVGVPWVDVRSAESRAAMKQSVEAIKALRDDPLVIGYFTDNEQGWWDETVFQHFLSQPWTDTAKQSLWKMADRAYHGDVRAFSRDITVQPVPRSFRDLKGKLTDIAWARGRRPLLVEEFVEWMADEYYAAAAAAVREADPNHLVLGDRYASYYSQPVARAAGRHADVVTTNFNTYAPSGWVSPSYFDSLYQLAQKPLMITEYYFSAMENRSGDRNRSGPFMVVQTQAQRTAGAREMTERLARLPYVVGYHWFQYTDEPPQGRADGEDFNFGLVDTRDEPYEGLVGAFTEINGRADALHREGRRPTDGLARDGAGWVIPRAPGPLSVEGRLDEWALGPTWAPAPGARTPFQPFGDFHLTWTPDELAVGFAFFNFAAAGTASEDPLDHERLSLVLIGADGRRLTVTLGGLGAREGAAPADPKHDDRPYAALRPIAEPGREVPAGAAGIRGRQSHNSIQTIAEVAVPAGALGAAKLKPGDLLRVGVSVRLRGDVKETFWPVSLSGTAFADGALAQVTLGS